MMTSLRVFEKQLKSKSKMKKTFVIQVEYPDCDFVPSEEVIEVAQECIEHYMERHFGANIMDGDYDRIKVKEVTDFIALVKRMREAQKNFNNIRFIDKSSESYKDAKKSRKQLESEVDKYLKKMEE